MRILITGASSGLGAHFLRRLLEDTDAAIWCTRHRKQIPVDDSRLNIIDVDLVSGSSETFSNLPIDLVIHFAGVTHASDEEEYWHVNGKGTVRLAHFIHQSGCRRFVYISTRCASETSGAYGQSKLAAERELQKMDWQSLLIIRPAEIYGQNGKEGIDRLLRLARKWRVVPAFFGHRELLFAPLHIDDFTQLAMGLIKQPVAGVRIEHACGPEDLSGVELARRISRHYHAIPIPLFWPAVSVCLKALHGVGVRIVKPDQLQRLTAEKTATAKDQVGEQRAFRRFLMSDTL